ncbi:acetyl/propionyl/methylcrotonyl-CoA carboxylase subunit alpha [Rhodobacteraceae bacterium CCMM004]|nr:acetyl/propionyl/methylcrotonyl-CoA carboxylase subunit alpha [Rhodobacteraceae bacterium CCMM004]
MIGTLLIANRGEIACRVIATARSMGVSTVAVHSDADAGARHVEMADRAVRIGPAPVSESYLRADAILEAARATGADAIHPGYGFLSENPDFVEAVEGAGLIFVGPPAAAIRAMGLKDAAKAAMQRAGVPVVPGYHGERQEPDFLAGEADAIGYPVLIKARAGGGGKGMRRVDGPDDFAEALEGARREAEAAFGDPACLIEKYVDTPRHVEIQVFADAHGNVVHLFERDCSLQRRHQKVIEEAPAPGMTPEVRAAMGAAAVEAARAIGYVGAGTVEFIADGSRGLRPGGFWFMEMNTRLQVEHPVTEAITGLDLVALQLRVAAGEPLPFAQEDLRIDGHAFEARLYAEDASRGFLPATGRLAHLRFPAATAFARGPVRVDSGVRPGDAITTHYDPMIAKLIVHGPDRAAALRRLRHALAETQIVGTVTNRDFLAALAGHAGFAAGEVDTGLIARDQDALTAAAAPDAEVWAVAALAALGLPAEPPGRSPWDALTGWRAWGPAVQNAVLIHSGTRTEVPVAFLGPGRFAVGAGQDAVALSARCLEDGAVEIVCDGITRRLTVHRGTDAVWVLADGGAHRFDLPDPLAAAAGAEAAADTVTAPMPGLVKRLAATQGQAVTAGQRLAVLEAMKMEHTLTAPRDGTVAEVLVSEGAQVSDGDPLIRLETADE